MFELWKLNRAIKKTETSYNRRIEQATKGEKSSQEIENLRNDEAFQTDIIEDARRLVITRQLRGKASEMMLPTPAVGDGDNLWEFSQHYGRWYLTEQGIVQVRSAIQEESRARREGWLAWFAPAVGLVGALTGLVAVLTS